MMIMLASDICRTIIRQQPLSLLTQLQEWSVNKDEIVISAITYAELVAAALLTSEQERHMVLVEEFCSQINIKRSTTTSNHDLLIKQIYLY